MTLLQHLIILQNLEALEDKVVDLLHSRWNELGNELKMSKESLQEIGLKCKDDIERCRAVLTKWKQSSDGAYLCHVLLNAIANMGHNELAQYLYKHFQIPLTKI